MFTDTVKTAWSLVALSLLVLLMYIVDGASGLLLLIGWLSGFVVLSFMKIFIDKKSLQQNTQDSSQQQDRYSKFWELHEIKKGSPYPDPLKRLEIVWEYRLVKKALISKGGWVRKNTLIGERAFSNYEKEFPEEIYPTPKSKEEIQRILAEIRSNAPSNILILLAVIDKDSEQIQ